MCYKSFSVLRGTCLGLRLKHTHNYGFFVESKRLMHQKAWCHHKLVDLTVETLCQSFLYKMFFINKILLYKFSSWDQSDQIIYWHTLSIHKDLIIIIFVIVHFFFNQNLGDRGNDKEESCIPILWKEMSFYFSSRPGFIRLLLWAACFPSLYFSSYLEYI